MNDYHPEVNGMAKLKLLIISKDTENTMDQNYFFLEQELQKAADVMIWRKEGTLRNLLTVSKMVPDYILILNDTGLNLQPLFKDLHHFSIPKGLIINDIHRFTEERRRYIKKSRFTHLFSVVKMPFHKIYPEFSHQWRWLPHFVNSSLFKDYKLKKNIDFLLMGAVNEVYPTRCAIQEAFKGDSRFIHHPHPGYGRLKPDLPDQYYVGENYAREMNRAKIFFTCPSIYEYPVMKYYESLAVNTLLLAPSFPELLDLGFEPGKHFVDIDPKNVKEKAEYYLTHKAEREQIALQGHLFIQAKHTVQVRARQLLSMIEEAI